MKAIVLLLLLSIFTCFAGNAQDYGKLTLLNPGPRVGYLSVTVSFDSALTGITNQHKPDIEFTIGLVNKGINKIGPFSFELNGKLFTTDSLIVNAEEELSMEKDTVVIRLTEYRGEEYLIVEQIINGEDRDSLLFAWVDRKRLCSNVALHEHYSSTISIGNGHRSVTAYRLEKDKTNTTPCTVDGSKFSGLPKDITIKSIVINNK